MCSLEDYCEPSADLKEMLEKTQHFFSFWQLKAVAGMSLAYITSGFNWVAGELNASVPLFYILCGLFVADFIFGWAERQKLGKASLRGFGIVLKKFVRYAIYIALIVVAALIVRYGLGVFYAEFFNGFIGFMAAVELGSVVRHMDKLGIPVHPLIKGIVYAMPHKFKKELENFCLPENEEDNDDGQNKPD